MAFWQPFLGLGRQSPCSRAAHQLENAVASAFDAISFARQVYQFQIDIQCGKLGKRSSLHALCAFAEN